MSELPRPQLLRGGRNVRGKSEYVAGLVERARAARHLVLRGLGVVRRPREVQAVQQLGDPVIPVRLVDEQVAAPVEGLAVEEARDPGVAPGGVRGEVLAYLRSDPRVERRVAPGADDARGVALEVRGEDLRGLVLDLLLPEHFVVEARQIAVVPELDELLLLARPEDGGVDPVVGGLVQVEAEPAVGGQLVLVLAGGEVEAAGGQVELPEGEPLEKAEDTG